MSMPELAERAGETHVQEGSPSTVAKPVSDHYRGEIDAAAQANLYAKLAWIAVGIFLIGLGISAVMRSQSDFYIYRDAGIHAAAGKPIYDLSDLSPFQHAPIYALLFVPFGWMPLRWAQAVWFLFSTAVALPMLIIGNGRLLFGRNAALRAELVLLPVLLCVRFILPSLDHGQTDFIVLALISWGLAFANESRPLAAGGLLAASVLIKPLGLVPLVYLTIRRRWSVIVWSASFGLLLIAAPILVFGTRGTVAQTHAYVTSLSQRVHTQRLLHDLSSPNDQSATAIAVRILSHRKGGLGLMDTGAAANAGFIFQMALMLLVAWWAARHADTHGDGGLLATGAIFTLIPAIIPTAWMGYYSALMVSYMALIAIACAKPLLESPRARIAAGGMAASFAVIVGSRFVASALFYGAPYVGSLITLAAIVWIAGAAAGPGHA
jgi:Glycosyltransferase family 87